MSVLLSLFLCVHPQEGKQPPQKPGADEKAAPESEPLPAPQGLNAFNPSITIFGNALWRLDNKDVIEVEDGEIIEKHDKFLLRETEVDFRAAIDPYADGVLIVALEQEIPNEFEVEVEEGYALIKSLPIGFWEEPPLGITIKVGRFFTSAGRHNRLHTHDLPQSQRGLAFETFIGEHAWIANGVSVAGFLPSLSESDAPTLTLEAFQGGGFVLGEDGEEQPGILGNLNWFWQLGDEHSLDVGVIGAEAHNDSKGRDRAQLLSADFLYAWKPLREGAWNSVIVAGQVFYGSRDAVRDNPVTLLPEAVTDRALGGFAYAQYQLDRRWYAGMRGDWTESLENRDLVSTRLNPYLSWYVSEFFRLRVGYEHTWSDDRAMDDLDTFLLEVNVVFGAHPPHPYWVNP